MREAGFAHLEIDDTTDDWGAFCADRATAFQADRSRFVRVHGRTVCDAPVIAPVSGKPCLSYTYSAYAEFSERVVDKSDPHNQLRSIGWKMNRSDR